MVQCVYLFVQKEKRIRELHSMLQKKFSAQVGSANNDDSRASDSAFSEVCVYILYINIAHQH